jgi:FkbM family methyltransferase
MIKKKFFKRPFYKIAGRIAKIMRDFQKREDEKIIKKRDDLWNDLFRGKDFFEFNLNSDVKMNLYKDSVLSRLMFEGFEKEETDYLFSVLKEGDVFVDIGANVGLFSLIASTIVGKNGKVISFEPAPKTFARLIENVKLNDLKNIDTRNIGLSNVNDELTFYVSKNGYDAWNSFAPSQDNKLESSIQVSVSTLDVELENIEKSKIKLIKMDVEGWEKFVLKGGREFFTNYRPIVMVEFTEENTFNAGYPVYDVFDIMIDFGYEWFTIKQGELISEKKRLYYPYNNLIAIKKD